MSMQKRTRGCKLYVMLLQNVLGSWPRECGNQIQNTQKQTQPVVASPGAQNPGFWEKGNLVMLVMLVMW